MNFFFFQPSSDKVDSTVEAQPLWEYPGTALSLPFTIAKFNFNENVSDQNRIETVMKIPIIS